MTAGAGEVTDWLAADAGGIRITVRVTPRAARSEVRGIETDAAGSRQLAVRVQAPPDGGRANAEVVRLLARRWGVAPRDLALVGGRTARRKVLRLEGPCEVLARTLREVEGDRPKPGASR